MVSSSYFGLNGARRAHVCPPTRTQTLTSTLLSRFSGKCAANIEATELNMNAPKELLNLDVFHKRSTARNVEAMPHGRFPTAPRSKPPSRARECFVRRPRSTVLPRCPPSQTFLARRRWRAQTTRCRAGSFLTRTTSLTAISGPRTF